MVEPGSYDAFPFIADFYDFTVPYVHRPDIGFYVQEAREFGGPMLEVGCGTGRILIPTARAGIEITGIDLSERMLAQCQANVTQEPPEVQERIKLARADMRDFDLGRGFRLITVPFRPFQHLNLVEEQVLCLTALRRHLAADGRLIFDVYNPDIRRLSSWDPAKEDEPEPPFKMPDGRTVVRRFRATTIDLFGQQTYGELLFDVTYPDGRTERLVEPLTMRYFFRYELEHLLARCGYAVETVYGAFDKKPYGEEYPGELIMVARTAD